MKKIVKIKCLLCKEVILETLPMPWFKKLHLLHDKCLKLMERSEARLVEKNVELIEKLRQA